MTHYNANLHPYLGHFDLIDVLCCYSVNLSRSKSFLFEQTACSLGLSATSQQYFLSEQTSHQQPASSTLLSEQTSTSHQPPANRTGSEFNSLYVFIER
jgi:hypothetical protein